MNWDDVKNGIMNKIPSCSEGELQHRYGVKSMHFLKFINIFSLLIMSNISYVIGILQQLKITWTIALSTFPLY